MPGLSETDRARIAREYLDPPPVGTQVKIRGTVNAWYRGRAGKVAEWFVNIYGPTFEPDGAMKPCRIEFGRLCWVQLAGEKFRVAVHPKDLTPIG